MFCHQSLRASRSSATLMIKVKTVSSSIYKACLVNRHKLWRNDFCGRLGEPSYLCLIWSILFEENQCIVHPSPPPTPHKKKLCSAEFIKGCLRGRFLKSGRRGNLMKKDLEIFSFSRLSKAWGKSTDDVSEKQNDAILYQLLSCQVACLYTESDMLKGHNKQLTSKKTTEYRQR